MRLKSVSYNKEWVFYFDQYKQIPEFKEINFNISISEFKTIYYWEYIHRLLARLIGLFSIIPLIYFYFKNKNKIYLYKNSPVIREIEPYLYDLGFNLIDMPIIKFDYQNVDDAIRYEKLKEILDKFFENKKVHLQSS